MKIRWISILCAVAVLLEVGYARRNKNRRTTRPSPSPRITTSSDLPDFTDGSTPTLSPDFNTTDVGPTDVSPTDGSILSIEDMVKEAFRNAVDEIEIRRGVNRIFKNLGIDGKTTKNDRFNRRRDGGHSDDVIDLGEIVLETTKQLSRSTGMEIDEMISDPEISAVVALELCPDGNPPRSCDKSNFDRFRSIDGRCNNKKNPRYGASLSTEPRFLQAEYEDDLSSPRKSVLGGDLPSPRYISNIVFSHKGDSVTPGEGYNTLLSMCWGQFLDHDFVLTPTLTGEDHESITCCVNGTAADRPECLPIDIPSDDPFFNQSCMPLVRSAAAPQEDMCTLGRKEVINEITSFIDASNVYGSSFKFHRELRNLTAGLMDMKDFGGSGLDPETEMLPEDLSSDSICVMSTNSSGEYCQLAGDIRVNVQPALGGLHLLFVREHQRIVRELTKLRPGWKDNRLFQEARKIVGALMQHITYKEYLPIVLNEKTRRLYDLDVQDSGYSDMYDSNINPGIRNEFAAAVFRFGHSQITDTLAYLMADFNTIRESTPLEATLLDPKMLVTNGGQNVANLTRFIMTNDSKRVDRFFESAIRNTLFGHFDLTSFNIQRGRDHGISSFVHFRAYCGLPVPKSFDAADPHFDSDVWDRLRTAYGSVEDIDLYVGGMSETRLPMSYLGPTFSCLLGEQFMLLKKGDRFWYERPKPEGFTPEQLQEIRKVTLSKVLCNNFGIEMAQPDAFHQPFSTNERRSCDELPDMSFKPWD